LEVAAINGLTVVSPKQDQAGFDEKEVGAEVVVSEKSIVTRSNIPLANIFFRVSKLKI
jgi:hypothetical protein